jgi:hypothetical protein
MECKIEGNYNGLQTITFFDGLTYNIQKQTLLLHIEKIIDTPNTYLLVYTFDNRTTIKVLGNIIDNRLVAITPTSVLSTFNLVNDKLIHDFTGIENNISISGTGILEKLCNKLN